MIIDFNKEYDRHLFKKCILCDGKTEQHSLQYWCNQCKIIIERAPAQDKITAIWLNWENLVQCSDQNFYIFIEHHIEFISRGQTVKTIPRPNILDIKRMRDNIEKYKLLA